MVTKRALTVAEIEAALKRSGGVVTDAAKLLGVHVSTIKRTLARAQLAGHARVISDEVKNRFRIGNGRV